MLAEQVTRKYGRALFLAAQSRKQTDIIRTDAEGLVQLISHDRMLLDFLNAPQVPDDKKEALVKSVFTSRVSPLMMSFLNVLIEKHRIAYLTEILGETIRLIKEEAGIVTAKVITASPMSAADQQSLIAKLSTITKKTIAVETRVDPGILGGVIVILGDTIIDGSIQHHLRQLREQLDRVKVA